jgi:hypothetical protein
MASGADRTAPDEIGQSAADDHVFFTSCLTLEQEFMVSFFW